MARFFSDTQPEAERVLHYGRQLAEELRAFLKERAACDRPTPALPALERGKTDGC